MIVDFILIVISCSITEKIYICYQKFFCLVFGGVKVEFCDDGGEVVRLGAKYEPVSGPASRLRRAAEANLSPSDFVILLIVLLLCFFEQADSGFRPLAIKGLRKRKPESILVLFLAQTALGGMAARN